MSDFNQIGEEQKQKAAEIMTHETRVATDLSEVKDKSNMDMELYDVSATEQENAFINKLFEVEGVEKEFSAKDRIRLQNIKQRNAAHLLMNDHKLFGDSGYMGRVKSQVGLLEQKLAEKNVDKAALDETERLFQDAITACDTYMQNKNPWFSTGKRRYAMVEKQREDLSKELLLFQAGRLAYDNGLGDEEQVAINSPMDIMVYGRERQERMTTEMPKLAERYIDAARLYDDVADERKDGIRDDYVRNIKNHTLFVQLDRLKVKRKHQSMNDKFEDIKNADEFFMNENLVKIRSMRADIEKARKDHNYIDEKELLKNVQEAYEKTVLEMDLLQGLKQAVENTDKNAIKVYEFKVNYNRYFDVDYDKCIKQKTNMLQNIKYVLNCINDRRVIDADDEILSFVSQNAMNTYNKKMRGGDFDQKMKENKAFDKAFEKYRANGMKGKLSDYMHDAAPAKDKEEEIK